MTETLLGTDLIQRERLRQIAEEGWTPAHDDSHGDGELALAACCYAAPEQLYIKSERPAMIVFEDPWPWAARFDKRFSYGDSRTEEGGGLPVPATYSTTERIDLLVKAGALIAAEIDRLTRAAERKA